MEEAKTVLESISRIEYYQIIRSQIEHEDNLINQRLSWFVAAQAFLFSAYAISSMRRRRYVYKASLHNKKSSFFSFPWSPLV